MRFGCVLGGGGGGGGGPVCLHISINFPLE